MQLPIPIHYAQKVYTEAEVESPRAGVLADTKKVSDQNKWFSAVHTLVSGCVTMFKSEDEEVTDKATIRAISRYMCYRNAEYLSVQAILKISPDDGFEGVYPCPRCGAKVITEYQDDGAGGALIDTRDFVSDLKVHYMEDDEPEFVIDLVDPVRITSNGEVIEEIVSFKMRYPSINDCIVSEARYGNNNALRMQFGLYVEALTEVNGEEADKRWKNQFGVFMFENMKNYREDMKRIDEAVLRYGMETTLRKVCPECGKEWDAPINTSNFFVSALHAM